MKGFLAIVLIGLAGAPWMAGQDLVRQRDFLTDHEADLIRVAQDPNDRIKQYLHFARLRLELVQQALTDYKPGRSQIIHRNLDEYGRIIETVDIVVDDALAREVEIKDGLGVAAEQEAEFLASLQKIAEDPQQDFEFYEFVLADAIEITQDSIELAQEDLGERKREILEADRRDEQKRLDTMAPERREDAAQEKKVRQRKETERKRKRPTLLNPGETTKRP